MMRKDDLKPFLLMVLVQCSLSMVNILYKLALGNGMSALILIAYRMMKKRPSMTWDILFQGFLCGLIGGTLGQSLHIQDLAYTSATFAAAMMNLVPAATFVLSVIYRIEKLSLTKIGLAKIPGTAIGVGGTMVLTFYKGPVTNPWTSNINLIEHFKQNGSTSHEVKPNQLLGLILCLASCFCYSFKLLIQAKMTQTFPYQYTITTMMSVNGSIMAVALAVFFERNWSAWRLGWSNRLLTAAYYSGIVASGLMFTLMAWCVWKRGPLFVAVFNPLMLVFVAIVGSFCLDEKLHLGRLIGAFYSIVIGLYAKLVNF